MLIQSGMNTGVDYASGSEQPGASARGNREECKIEFLEVGKEFVGCLLLGELKLRFISKVKRFGLVSYF